MIASTLKGPKLLKKTGSFYVCIGKKMCSEVHGMCG